MKFLAQGFYTKSKEGRQHAFFHRACRLVRRRRGVRIFYGVGGPNFTSAFHVIGEIFDRVYNLASLTSPAQTDVQTTLVPPGGATAVEFKLEVPGRYILVDHALSRLERGLAGFLFAEGPDNPAVFDGKPLSGAGSGGH